MDAVLSEPKGSSGACFTCADHVPADEVDPGPWSHIVPMQAGGTYVLGTGVGKTDHYLRDIGLVQRAGRVNRVRDATDRAHAVLDALDEQEVAGSPLVLHLDGHRSSALAPQPGVVRTNLLVQCKSCHDRLATPADLTERDPLVLSAATVSAEPGARWQALPYYANRPFVGRSCCRASALTPEAVSVAVQHWKTPVPRVVGGMSLLQELFPLRMRAPVAPLTVTIVDKQIAQDYRQSLRGLVGGVLEVLGRMLVMVLTALSHLAQVPSFLLVMLGAIRHYGRRGESDGHFPLTLRVQPMTPRGAACLAA